MKNWVIPCNLKNFDITSWFSKQREVVWKQTMRVSTDDVVYIYVGTPVKAIRYKCIVVDNDVNGELLEKSKYAQIGDYEHSRKYMQLKLIKEYDEGISLETLKNMGMYMVRKQSRLDDKIVDFISAIN